MKILVPIKHTIDANVRPLVRSDGQGVDVPKYDINPFCLIAVEEAVRLKEAGHASHIVVVTIGADHAQESLRKALALGADEAIHVQAEDTLEPLAIAKILAYLVAHEKAEFVLTGKQSIDGDNGQTGPMLAALLGWSQGTFASEIVWGEGEIHVVREVDAGLETVALTLPAVVSADLRLNEPRLVSLPDVMKAKSKPLRVCEIAETGVDVSPRLQVKKVMEPPSRQAGEKVESVQALADKILHVMGGRV